MALHEKLREFSAADEMGRYTLFIEIYRSGGEQDQRGAREALQGGNVLLKLLFLQYLAEIAESRAIAWILPWLEDPAQEVREAAAGAYRDNGWRHKDRQLRPYVNSPHPDAVRFAIRTLARRKDKDVLPVLLARLPKAELPVRLEIIDALRFLRDRVSISALRKYLESSAEPERYRTVRSLLALQAAGLRVPLDYFLGRVQDASARVRRAALLGLRKFPSKQVAQMFLEKSLAKSEPMESRLRALQGLGAFPHKDWVRPLVGLMSEDVRGPLRLTAEIVLKHFPATVRAAGLLPLLGEKTAARPEAVRLLAETLGEDPKVRERLIRFWEQAREPPDKLVAIEALGFLGGPEVPPLLLGVLRGDPLLAHAAIVALNRLWAYEGGPKIMRLLQDPALAQYPKQALLHMLLKRGPDESVLPELLPWLHRGLENEVLNIRYLSLRLMAWYPLEKTIDVLLGFLTREDSEEALQTAYRIIADGLGKDPLPLLAVARRFPDRGALRVHLGRILLMREWAKNRARVLLSELVAKPLRLPVHIPEAFLSLCLRLIERGSISLEEIWPLLPADGMRCALLKKLGEAREDSGCRVPPLPLGFLASHLAGDADSRGLLYDLLGRSRQQEGIVLLVDYLLKEEGKDALRRGRRSLQRLIREGLPV